VSTAGASPDHLARENERLRRSVEELSLLNELAVAIGAAADSHQIVETIIRKAMKSLHAEQGDLLLIRDLEAGAASTFIRTTDSEVNAQAIRTDDLLPGWMLRHKRPLLLNTPRHDPRFSGAAWHPAIRNLLSVPLLIRSELIGLLTVYNRIDSVAGFTADDQRLLAIIAAQSAQVVENARLMEEERALERMRDELRLATEIQASLFPQSLPVVPGYDLAGASIAAERVGGDYYDALALEGGRIGLCVGDASGKGLPASLLMASVQAALRSLAPWSASCSECLTRINQVVCERNRRGSFVTLVYTLLDPSRHVLHFANAGHNRPLLCRADGTVERLEEASPMLGFTTRITFSESLTHLAPGDLLLLYSDGLNEAWSATHEQFGEDRVVALLRRHRAESSRGIVDGLTAAVRTHTGDTPPSDDLTLLVVKRNALAPVAA
jgi:sigma-B regulation protein RsbU (phosphoserine phosphatase)